MSNSVEGEDGRSPPSENSRKELSSAQQNSVDSATTDRITLLSHASAPTTATKRKLPRTLDPTTVEIIELSPETLLASNNFVCELCSKRFQREQNLQLHMRGHNLPWKLKLKTRTEVGNRIYICPEAKCLRHNPANGLMDYAGIRKHFCRKHGERKWKCATCNRAYAVRCDWKAHIKTCGNKKYRCDCGSAFSRKDSFMSHKRSCKEPTVQETSQQEVTPDEGYIQHMNSELILSTGGGGQRGGGSEFAISGFNHDTGHPPGSKFTDFNHDIGYPPESKSEISDFNHDAKNLSVSLSHYHMSISFMNMGGMFLSNSSSLLRPTSLHSYAPELQVGSRSMTSFNSTNYVHATGNSSSGFDSPSALASLQAEAQMDATSGINVNSQMIRENFVSGMVGSDPNPTHNSWSYEGSSIQQMTSGDQLVFQTNQQQYHCFPQFVGVGNEYSSSQFLQNQTAADSSLLPNLGMYSSSAAPWLSMDGEHGFQENLVYANTNILQTQPLDMGTQGADLLSQVGPTASSFAWDGNGVVSETRDRIRIGFLEMGESEPRIIHGEYQHQRLSMEFDQGNQERLQSTLLPYSYSSMEKNPFNV